MIATYGWRLYAVPVLVVVSVLVMIRAAGDDGAGGGAQAEQNAPDVPGVSGQARQTPEVTESPALPPNLKIPTADLPAGSPYPAAGGGAWTVLPGRTDRVGAGGKLFTYTIEVENGIDLSLYGGNDSFGRLVDSTLADPRGWAAGGDVSVQRVDGDEEPDIRMSLSTPETVHRSEFCGFSIKYESSCWRRDEKRVMINLARWVRGAIAFGGDIGSYREYAINHEIGHAFGRGHTGCLNEGDLAPVMMQQSFGTANNYVSGLNDQAGNADPVKPDGKTCRVNQWPNPQARPPS
jgi:uncharacterized protein DUF3152